MNLVKLFIVRAGVFSALALTAGLLCAQPSGTPPAEGQHRKPPQEALDACKSLKAGQDCNFTAPRGAVKGSCFAPEGKPLACRPKDAAGGTAAQSPPPKK